MSLSQEERFALRREMRYDDLKRAWGFRWSSFFSEFWVNWYTPLVLIDYPPLFLAWYGAVYYLSPLNMGLLTNFHGDLPFAIVATRILLFSLHFLFLFGVVGYVVQVLFNVPWGRRFPLASAPDVEPLKWVWLHFVVLGLIGLRMGNGNVGHAIATLAEGLVLLYFYRFQPALGFIQWTSKDARMFKEELESRIGNINHALTPNKSDETYEVPFNSQKSDKTFASIFGMAVVKEKLLEPAKRILAERKPGAEAPRNGFLLHGEPGNGKTVFALALAGELNIPIIEVTYGQISSQWLGNMPKVIANTFTYAKRCAPCVLFVDEIDSFIRSRDTASGNSEDLKITNTLLTEIVNLRGHKVILMAATNYLANLDAAAIREGRFDYKVEIAPPDEEARVGIVQAGIKLHASSLEIVDSDALSVAKRWNGFSVSRLMAVCKALPEVARKLGSNRIGHAQWMLALREVQGRHGKLPGDTKSMSELILDGDTREALELVVSRLKDVARIEALGGTLPSGMLFHGPSGTGKTAAVRAMAKEVGWAFLSVAGPDLLADRTKLDKLFAEAKDIRPTIVFIDEADDILRNRQYSSTPDLVNKLLTIMDGTEDKVKDVVWVAATNNPDQIDPALLRSGRFTEKVLFTIPPQDQIPRHISMWLKKRNVGLDSGLDAFDLAESMASQTIADVEGVLQYALNCAISRTFADVKPVIKRSDVMQALRVVLNQGQGY